MTRRAVAAITLGAGAVLVVLGSLFPLYGVESEFPPGPDGQRGGRVAYALTSWEAIREPAPRVDDGNPSHPVYGYGLVAAALLVGAGALLHLRSPLQAALGRFAALVGFGLLVGTVWAALETLQRMFDGGPSVEVTDFGFVGSGTWLLVVAGAAVLVGAVLAQDWPARAPRPTGMSVYQVEDDDTPPFGIAIPVAGPGVPGPNAPAGSRLDVAVHPDTAAPPVPEPSGDDRRHPTG